jgi:ABC-type nickel/cobalt efflux system permease component RcnA
MQQRRQQGHHQHGGWFDSDHEHGPDTHTHEYEGKLADWAAGNATKPASPAATKPGVSWKSLLALGVSGGLIPCPSALVVLLGAIALGRVGFGMLLIVAFSAGLAAVLTALGMALVYTRTFFEKLPTNGVLLRALPIASAILVTLAGCAISASALVQAGLL